MAHDNSAQNGGITSDERIRNVLRRHIQRAYDRGDFTRAALALESGVSLSQIDQLVSHDPAKQRRVTAEDAFNLAYTLGEAAVAALIGTIHYTASRPAGDVIAPGRLLADLLPQVAVMADCAADGRFDHTEAPRVREAADHIIASVFHLSSGGGKA